MKRIAAIMLICITLFVFQGSVLATGLDDLKTTFSLGPFEVSDFGVVMSRSESEVKTLSGTYSLHSLEGIGINDELIESEGIELLSEITAHYLVDRMKAEGLDAEVYRNSHGLYGLFYTMDMDGSGLLTMMMVYGKDCMIVVMNYDSKSTLMPYYAHYLMDNYSLVKKGEK